MTQKIKCPVCKSSKKQDIKVPKGTGTHAVQTFHCPTCDEVFTTEIKIK